MHNGADEKGPLMNANVHQPPVAAETTRAETLLQDAALGLAAFTTQTEPLRAALMTVSQLGNITTIKAAGRLIRKLDQFEPSVTLIGQIKSGKSTLVNSLIGQPNLLPADVNPWTSVVTSIHLCPRVLTPATSACFRFFENHEWDRLISGGGRIGELAERAGADDELTKIKEQVMLMREKSKNRLGRKFEILMGSEHSYGYFDRELVERYVCLGDDVDDQTNTTKSQGRFADITKSADLSMQQAGYPINLCIRDTPGVNDTFLIREQITIKSIRDSRICVVVLSAHQALSATDLGLIRLISQSKSREVIIFVNRIDELPEPATQIGEIEESIRATLKRQKCPFDAKILFGSALWAENAISGSLQSLPKASQAALHAYGRFRGADLSDDQHRLMWGMSGIPDLLGALSERITEGEGRDLIQVLTAETSTLISSIRMSDNLEAKSQIGEVKLAISEGELLTALDNIAIDARAEFDEQLRQLTQDFASRLDRAHQTFLARATDALAKHLEVYGEEAPWNYDPAGFRMMLNSAYSIYGTKCQAAYRDIAKKTLTAYRDLYQRALQLPADLFDTHALPPPHIKPPVSLGQTIALDLKGKWWTSWWTRRQSYQSQAARFSELIQSETISLITDLRDGQALEICSAMTSQLVAVTDGQNESFRNMIAGAAEKANVARLFDVDMLSARDTQLRDALSKLDGYAHAE